jgi:hypothetical protein
MGIMSFVCGTRMSSDNPLRHKLIGNFPANEHLLFTSMIEDISNNIVAVVS